MPTVAQGLNTGMALPQQPTYSKSSAPQAGSQASASQDTSGVQVTLQGEARSTSAYARPAPLPSQPASWTPDAISEQMQSNLSGGRAAANPLQRLTGILFDRIASDADSFEQSLARFGSLPNADRDQEHWVGGIGSARSSTTLQTLGFSLTTRSGTSVRIELSHQMEPGFFSANSLAAKVSINGNLSDAEREALGEMSELMERLAQEFMKTGKLTLDGLEGFDSDLFEKLKLDFRSGTDHYALTLNSTPEERTLSINWNGNKVDLSLDLAGNTLTSTEAKAQSLAHYLELIRDSVKKSDGETALADFMADSFATLHQLNDTESRNATIAQEKLPDNTLLTGMQDFSATFTSKYTQPNTHSEKFMERAGFTLELGQTSRVSGRPPIELSIDQEQHYSLSASYYRPLSFLEDVDFETQTYEYIEINEQSTRRTQQRYEMGRWVSAIHSEESQYHHQMTEYRLNDISRTVVKEDAQARLIDLTKQTQQELDSNNQLALLDSLLLTAPTRRNLV